MADTEFRRKLESLRFSFDKNKKSKTTVDVHDRHKVEVTEHWNDRQDVTVKPEPIHLKPGEAPIRKGPIPRRKIDE